MLGAAPVYPEWLKLGGVLDALRECFSYPRGDDRATGYLYAEGEQSWPEPLALLGPLLLKDLREDLGARFTIAAFQAYRNGTGCGWHSDTPFSSQAILSLGVTRTFGVRPRGGEAEWMKVAEGDLVFMPPGFQREWEHCVPEEDVPGERCSLVFRTPA
jgi:alkylated DNA repair dioxygenase AlkB